jgi:hypothetical protein
VREGGDAVWEGQSTSDNFLSKLFPSFCSFLQGSYIDLSVVSTVYL